MVQDWCDGVSGITYKGGVGFGISPPTADLSGKKIAKPPGKVEGEKRKTAKGWGGKGIKEE